MFADYQQMPAHSRVWIYQSKRAFSDQEVADINGQIKTFLTQWSSHQQALKAWGEVLHNRFVILMVDEQSAGASGCSIDKSVAFIHQVESNYNTDMFDRWQFAYEKGNTVNADDKDVFANLYEQGEINDATFVFNNLVKTKAELENGWKVPLGDSWHKNFVG